MTSAAFICCSALAAFLGMVQTGTAATSWQGGPLMVVVETAGGVCCDAGSVRAAIAAELGTNAVVSPLAAAPAAGPQPPGRTLLVACEPARIVVTLFGHQDQSTTRSVPAPADRAGRLRAIAWMASNMTRDQLTTISWAQPSPPPPAALPPVAATQPSTPVSEVAVAPPPPSLPAATANTAPPPFAAGATTQPAAVATVAATLQPPAFPRWTISIGAGAASVFQTPWQSKWVYPPSHQGVPWKLGGQLEVHRHSGALFLGAALDAGPRDVHPLGVALLVGRAANAGRVGLEASVGLGVGAFISRTLVFDGPPDEPTRIVPYARVAFVVAYPLSPSFELLAQLGGHASFTTGGESGFGLGTLGLRLVVP